MTLDRGPQAPQQPPCHRRTWPQSVEDVMFFVADRIVGFVTGSEIQRQGWPAVRAASQPWRPAAVSGVPPAAQVNDDVDPLHAIAWQRLGQLIERDMFGDVDEHAFVLIEEMRMHRGVGVEERPGAIDTDLPQQPELD